MYDQCGSLVVDCSCCVHLHVKIFFVRRDIYHSLAARNLSQPSGERFPQMVCGEIFFGWLQRAPLGGALTRNLSIGELFGLSENGKSSQKSFPLEPPGRGELLVEELSPGILGALLSNIGWSFSGAARYFLPMH